MMKTKILVYGVLGYTGNLFLEHHLIKISIVLGPREIELKDIAAKLGREYRIFEINAAQNISLCLSNIKAVINLANISYHVDQQTLFKIQTLNTKPRGIFRTEFFSTK